MCGSDPQTEQVTVWGFTIEEILHRWDIWTAFDPISRLFGGSKKGNVTPENNVNVIKGIQTLFGVDVTKLGVPDGPSGQTS
jgi:hypothetical protein